MTSRERVLLALNHKEPDKLPIDSGGMHSSGTSAMLYGDVKEYLGIQGGQTRIYDVIQQLAEPEQSWIDRFNVDVIDLASVFATDEADWVDWPLPNGKIAKFPAWIRHEKRDGSWYAYNSDGEAVGVMAPGAFYFDQLIHPFHGQVVDDFSDLPDHMRHVMWLSLPDQLWRHAARPDFYEMVARRAKELRETTDKAITLNYSSIVFEPGQWLYRNDEYFMKLMTDKSEIHALHRKLVDIHLERLDKLLDAAGPYCDVLITSDDLGMQSAPLLSPDLYREMIFPYHREVFQFVKQKSKMKTFLHTCGSIFNLIPHLIEAGVDIINPVQTPAVDMDPTDLKREYGKDIVFWGGGIDTQHTMAGGTVDEIRHEVRRTAEILMKDGGFVFNHIHNLLPGIPPENVVAMFDEANAITY
jgi:uroporphyrinogen decarboxylase